jgi:hypothetical protein
MFDFVAAGYVPVLTHPERLTWIRGTTTVFVALVKSGVWMQVTAGSLTAASARTPLLRREDAGRRPRALLATDAHGVRHRAPLLAEGREAAVKRVGAEEKRTGSSSNARRRFSTIARPGEVRAGAGASRFAADRRRGFFARLGRGAGAPADALAPRWRLGAGRAAHRSDIGAIARLARGREIAFTTDAPSLHEAPTRKLGSRRRGG